MRYSPTFVQLPTASASSVCDGLLQMAHCLIVTLPASELRGVHYTLESLLARTEQLLESAEFDLSLDFDDLAIAPENGRNYIPSGEDFGAVMVSTTVSTTTSESGSTLASSPRPRQGTISRVPVPVTAIPNPPPTPGPARVPTPAPAPAPTSGTHGPYPLILSSRQNVGFPDYTHHPHFVRPGIPGAYRRPPTASGLADQSTYYVVTKGLYVGIFDDWDEVGAWVLGVSGSLYRKADSWEKAKNLYNARLASGAVQVLA